MCAVQQGELGAHSPTLLLHERTHGLRSSHLALNCAAQGEDDMSKVKRTSSLLQWVQSWIFFSPIFCWNFSTELPYLHKGTCIHGWLSNVVFFGRKMVETSYSAICCPDLSKSSWVSFYFLRRDQEDLFIYSMSSNLTVFHKSSPFNPVNRDIFLFKSFGS